MKPEGTVWVRYLIPESTNLAYQFLHGMGNGFGRSWDLQIGVRVFDLDRKKMNEPDNREGARYGIKVYQPNELMVDSSYGGYANPADQAQVTFSRQVRL